MPPLSRREFLGATATSMAVLSLPGFVLSDDSLGGVETEVQKRHGEGVQRLQEWVKQPSIAAENRGMAEGCELMMRLAREAGFQIVTRMPTDGQPGVFATLDAGAARTARCRCRSVPRESSNWSSSRAARSGAGVPRRTFTPATARASTAPRSTLCKRWPR